MLKLGLGFAVLIAGLIGVTDQVSAETAIAPRRCELSKVEDAPGVLEAACDRHLRDRGLSPQQRGFAHYVRGYERFRGRKFEAAIEDYDAALKLIPNHAPLHRNRALLALEAGDHATAFAYLRRAIELDPTRDISHHLLGNAFLAINDRPKALLSWARALEINPALAASHYQRARILIDLRRLPEARIETEWLINQSRSTLSRQGRNWLRGRDADLWNSGRMLHAQMLSKSDAKDEAIALMAEVIAEEPTAVMYAERAAFWHGMPIRFGEAGHNKEAVADAMQAVKLDPKFAFAWNVLAIVLQHGKKHPEALRAIDRTLAIADDEVNLATTLWLRSRILQDLGKRDEAVESGILAYQYAFLNLPQSLPKLMTPLLQHKYLSSQVVPTSLTPELVDAITACRVDPQCW